MIGRPEWFTYRRFGWGVSPRDWKGWLYVAVAALVLGFITSMSALDTTKLWIAGIIYAVFIIDIMHIMVQLPKVHDERENYHQLLIERNCSFAAIGAMLGILAYEVYQARTIRLISETNVFNPLDNPVIVSLMVILAAMFVTKVVSNIYVNMKM
jgi:hypothetical protein